MQGLILAAGRGSRLNSTGLPKPLARAAGQTLAFHALAQFARAGIDRSVVVTGYASEQVGAGFRDAAAALGLHLTIVFNPQWRKANGMSVLAAAPALDGAYLMAMCDHVFAPGLLDRLIAAPRRAGEALLAVDRALDNADVDLADATRVRTHGDRIVAIGKALKDYDAFDCGAFVADHGLTDALADVAHGNGDAGISDGMAALAARRHARAVEVTPARWIDVDSPAMLARAHAMLDKQPL